LPARESGNSTHSENEKNNGTLAVTATYFAGNVHFHSTAMSYITSPTFLSALQEPKKRVDDHLGYPHRKPPSKPLLASGKLSSLLAIRI